MPRMGSGIRRNDPEVGQLQDRDIQDERQRPGQVGPHPRQQNAGHDNDQRIKEVQRTIHTAGGINHAA